MRIPVCVLGGMNMDITGTPAAPLLPGDSNPGSVRMSAGGVGRNIAENLGSPGLFRRTYGSCGKRWLREHSPAGLRGGWHRPALCLPLEGASSIYFCLMDGRGDMAAAINDMSLCDALTPQMLGYARHQFLRRGSLRCQPARARAKKAWAGSGNPPHRGSGFCGQSPGAFFPCSPPGSYQAQSAGSRPSLRAWRILAWQPGPW